MTNYFKGDSYANKPKAIAKYVKWAIRENSPALFGRSTSMECMVPNDNNAYILCLLNY